MFSASLLARAYSPSANGVEACPGGIRPVGALDGGLARVRLPGGALTAAQFETLAALSDRHGDGLLDLTARANVQMRGIAPSSHGVLAAGLADAGLLPSVAHELARNFSASPFAGIDPAELADVRPLVRAFDAAFLRDPLLAKLPPKFLFAFDGGGTPFDRSGADVAAVARPGGDFDLLVSGEPCGLALPPALVVGALVGLAREALALSGPCGAGDGRWRIARVPTLRRALVAFARDAHATELACSAAPRACDSASPDRRAIAPLGVRPGRDATTVTLVPAVPLGRLAAAQARAIARLVREAGADLRIAHWRGVVIGGVPLARVPGARSALADAGLHLDDRAGFAGVAACAGTDACGAARADVRADAATFAAASHATGARGAWSVNFAGCEKRCAMRGAADAEVVATATGYELRLGGATTSPGRAPAAASGLDARGAVARLVDLRAERRV